MMTFLRRLLSIITARRDTFLAASAGTPIHEDDPRAGSEAEDWSHAEYWLDFCRERYDLPLVRDPVARAMLSEAADYHETTGYCARYYQFKDGSRLSISDVVEMVL